MLVRIRLHHVLLSHIHVSMEVSPGNYNRNMVTSINHVFTILIMSFLDRSVVFSMLITHVHIDNCHFQQLPCYHISQNNIPTSAPSVLTRQPNHMCTTCTTCHSNKSAKPTFHGLCNVYFSL